MTTPAQPQIAWQATTVGDRRLQPGDITSVGTGDQAVLVRVTAVRPFPGGAEITAERVSDV